MNIHYLFLELFHYFRGRIVSILFPLKYKGNRNNRQPLLLDLGDGVHGRHSGSEEHELQGTTFS